ncbi:hypothetical protein [Nitrosomonas communis]|uniref:hypothetical protein n=1 Tax=Nitrosomonas communis TaxID=44574 RepID=UPI0026F36223|nr:hypothetical protein [Nitrosomonas communis]
MMSARPRLMAIVVIKIVLCDFLQKIAGYDVLPSTKASVSDINPKANGSNEHNMAGSKDAHYQEALCVLGIACYQLLQPIALFMILSSE